jgi:hypothetical protein
LTVSKPVLKPPRCQRLKLSYDEPLSNFALFFNLRRYIMAELNHTARVARSPLQKWWDRYASPAAAHEAEAWEARGGGGPSGGRRRRLTFSAPEVHWMSGRASHIIKTQGGCSPARLAWRELLVVART